MRKFTTSPDKMAALTTRKSMLMSKLNNVDVPELLRTGWFSADVIAREKGINDGFHLSVGHEIENGSNHEVIKWIHNATTSLLASEILYVAGFSEPRLYSESVFAAQQAAEKSFKAHLLLFRGDHKVGGRMIHNIEKLARAMYDKRDQSELAALSKSVNFKDMTNSYIVARYERDYTREEAISMITQAHLIFRLVVSDMHGMLKRAEDLRPLLRK